MQVSLQIDLLSLSQAVSLIWHIHSWGGIVIQFVDNCLKSCYGHESSMEIELSVAFKL